MKVWDVRLGKKIKEFGVVLQKGLREGLASSFHMESSAVFALTPSRRDIQIWHHWTGAPMVIKAPIRLDQVYGCLGVRDIPFCVAACDSGLQLFSPYFKT